MLYDWLELLERYTPKTKASKTPSSVSLIIDHEQKQTSRSKQAEANEPKQTKQSNQAEADKPNQTS